MPIYLVESYVPRTQASVARTLGERARAAALQLSREDAPVRYVRTTLLPGDEMCFHVFDAASEEAVAEACRRAGLDASRIMPVLEETTQQI